MAFRNFRLEAIVNIHSALLQYSRTAYELRAYTATWVVLYIGVPPKILLLRLLYFKLPKKGPYSNLENYPPEGSRE